MSSINEKSRTLINKVTCRPVKFLFNEHEVRITFSLKEDFA